MLKCYDSLCDLLGKPADDEAIDQLIDALGEMPREPYESSYARFYVFGKAGVEVLVDKRYERFWALFFHVATASTEASLISAYDGDMPAGITVSDERSAIESKLGKSPFRTDDSNHSDYFNCAPLILVFHFASEKGVVSAVSVRWEPDANCEP